MYEICYICQKKFKNLPVHMRVHDKKYMKNYKKKLSDKWLDPKFRKNQIKKRLGKNNHMFGKENKWGKHTEEAKKKISITRLGNSNPSKRPEVRKKISIGLKNRKGTSWNKGIKWNRTEFHDSKMEEIAKKLEMKGYRVFTTHKYVPDAIIVDFKNKKVKAFELNPSSIIRVEERSKQKGYDDMIHKVIKK